MSKVTIPEHLKGKELFDFLVKNKNILIAEKKATVKHSDTIHCPTKFIFSKDGDIVKSVGGKDPETEDGIDGPNELKAVVVMNSCLWMDSHDDVHIPGLWNKSISESKAFYHVQEHTIKFAYIISDEVNALTKNISWTDLGVNLAGNTETLLFKSRILKERNCFMFEQYLNGWVKNHSVGMRYVKIFMAINDSDYKEEFAIWNQYIDMIANKETAIDKGYFWAVKEAQLLEGSAVPIGSNIITPTLSIESKGTQTGEPAGATHHHEPQGLRFDKMAANWQ